MLWTGVRAFNDVTCRCRKDSQRAYSRLDFQSGSGNSGYHYLRDDFYQTQIIPVVFLCFGVVEGHLGVSFV